MIFQKGSQKFIRVFWFVVAFLVIVSMVIAYMPGIFS
jgi:hypothetical protein